MGRHPWAWITRINPLEVPTFLDWVFTYDRAIVPERGFSRGFGSRRPRVVAIDDDSKLVALLQRDAVLVDPAAIGADGWPTWDGFARSLG